MEQDIDRQIGDLARRQHGIFSRAQLVAVGVSRGEREHRLTSGRWELVADGVYRVNGAPTTWRSELLSACWAGGMRALASHRSAAALWRLPGGRKDYAEITAPRWNRTRTLGLVVHESKLLTALDADMIDAIPVTTVERTIFDLCRKNTFATIDAMLDNALRRELTTLDALDRACDRLATKGRPGGQRFREALDARAWDEAVPESPPERLLARALVTQGLPKPVFQHVVRDDAGQFVARVDLAYPDVRLAVEYDSYQEHTGKLALVRDSSRRNHLTSVGWTTLTATHADIQNRGFTLSRQVRSLHRRLRQQTV